MSNLLLHKCVKDTEGSSTETKSLGWNRGWKTCRKGWKTFCRENAEITVEEHLETDLSFTN